MPNIEFGRTELASGAKARLPESTYGLTTAQVIGEFNSELIAAGVPEAVRELAPQQAVFAYFQRSGVILAKKVDA